MLKQVVGPRADAASTTDTLHEPVNGRLVPSYRSVLDSKTLFHELKSCSDYLASGLMDAGLSGSSLRQRLAI